MFGSRNRPGRFDFHGSTRRAYAATLAGGFSRSVEGLGVPFASESNPQPDPHEGRIKTVALARNCCFWLALLLGAILSPLVTEAVEIVLLDGSRVQADRIVPEQTDAVHLTLSIDRAGIRLTRTLRWERVAALNADDDALRGVDVPSGIRLVGYSQSDDDVLTINTLPPIAPPELPCPPSVPPPVWLVDPQWLLPPLPPQGVVVGVREDPLNAYLPLLLQQFPNGVPQLEAGFARDVLRARTAQDLLWRFPLPFGPSPLLGPFPSQAVPTPAPVVPPAIELNGIEVQARPINREGKTDWDALEIEVIGWGRDRRPVLPTGTLQVTLRGQTQSLVPLYNSQLLATPGRVTELGRWSVMLTPNTAGRSIAVVPLSRPLPDHDLTVAAVGDLHARLSVPGQGSFEAVQPVVPLRHSSPVRERNVAEGGSLFFPDEGTSDTPRPLGRSFLPSSLRPDRRIFAVQP